MTAITTDRRLVTRPTACLLVLFAALGYTAGCAHSDGFGDAVPAEGPFNPGPDIRLTLNADQDYWPAWTEDGAGILYEFIRPGMTPQHRCIGLLPAAGGRIAWQLCDDRATQADSVNSFPAYALGGDGRLLYAEAVAPKGVGAATPAELTLWLADSVRPLVRRSLLSLPGFAGTTPVAWLADIQWTGPNTFVALAQDFTILGHCRDCGPDDSIFVGKAVVSGTIAATGATLTPIAGTEDASGYSLAENGATIVFTRRDDGALYKVPAGGGAATVVATLSPQILGVSCQGSTCVVASDPVTLSEVTTGDPPVIFPSIQAGPRGLFSVSLSTGAARSILSLGENLINPIVATPKISPVTGDVVAQVGGAFGHLQSFTAFDSDLHLYQNLVH